MPANTDAKSEVCAVILAAGFSTRFGSNKLIMDVGGKPIISHAVESALGSSADRVAVVIPVGSTMRTYISTSVTLITNALRDKGISSSIAAAVEYFKESADAIMFMVADQPMIDTCTLDKILSIFRQNPSFIVASSVDGDVRNPVIFPKKYFEVLLQLTGDSGAKSVALANIKNVIKVEVNPEKLVDIDTVEDLAELNSRIKK
ncbi:MAG: nucleotidyltransferase family protein [Thermoplasmataceae archaeon]